MCFSLCTDPPSYEMDQILQDPVFSLVVHYIEGSPLLDADLDRAKAETAVAIFLLSDKFCEDADTEDTKIILQQLSIERYMLSYGSNSEVTFCMQLLRPQNKKHLGDIEENDQKLVVCLNEMKMGVLAKACLFQGMNTLIFNLLSSFAEDEDPLTEKGGTSRFDPDATEEDEIGTWLEEYEKGCGWEIYITELADVFEGQKFVDLAYILYEKIGIVLFALRIKDLKGKQHTRVLLNPADFVIPNKDDYVIEGFVVAENKKQSDLRFAPVADSIVGGANPFQLISNLAKLGGHQDGNSIPTNGRRDSVSSSGTAPESRKGSAIKKSLSSRWQDIKADYDNEREMLVGNTQEVLSKQEAEYVQNSFFVRSKPLSIEESTIETSVLDEVPNVNQHIIIIGKGLNSLYDFIKPWRAKYLGRLRHIVILNPNGVSEATWRRVSIFEGILYVKGSALEENDLRRAGIFKASQVVVLADGVRKSKTGASNSSDALEDADAIFSYQLVKRLNEKAHVVVEIVHSSNVSYLDSSEGHALVRAEDYKFTPQFASGTLYTSSLLDAVLCQTFYNPQIIKVVDKLISGTDHKPDESLTDSSPSHSTKRKKNAVVNSKMFDGMGSSLHQILVPDNLKKQTYGELFKALSQRGMIPLGLLRGTFPAMNIGPKGNKLPYVYTNPSKETEVFSCDKVFVLSQKSLNTTKFTADELHENFLKQTETAIMTRKAEKDGDVEFGSRHRNSMVREMDRFFSTISGEVQNISNVIDDLKKSTVSDAVSAFNAAGASVNRGKAASLIKPSSLNTTSHKVSAKGTGVSQSGMKRKSMFRSQIKKKARPRSVSTDTNATVSSED